MKQLSPNGQDLGGYRAGIVTKKFQSSWDVTYLKGEIVLFKPRGTDSFDVIVTPGTEVIGLEKKFITELKGIEEFVK